MIYANRVTIYRVLDRLEEEGKIHKIVNVDGVVNYAKCHNCEKNDHHHNHLHFNCEECHTVTCIENMVPDVVLPKDFLVKSYNFVVSGICANCVKSQF